MLRTCVDSISGSILDKFLFLTQFSTSYTPGLLSPNYMCFCTETRDRKTLMQVDFIKSSRCLFGFNNLLISLFLSAPIIFCQTSSCWKEGNWKLAVTHPCLQLLIAWFYLIQFPWKNVHPPKAPKPLSSILAGAIGVTEMLPCLLLPSLPAHLLVSFSICLPFRPLPLIPPITFPVHSHS